MEKRGIKEEEGEERREAGRGRRSEGEREREREGNREINEAYTVHRVTAAVETGF